MLKLIELFENKYLYRCDRCGWESPNMTKEQSVILPKPEHECKKSREDANQAAFRIVREATERD